MRRCPSCGLKMYYDKPPICEDCKDEVRRRRGMSKDIIGREVQVIHFSGRSKIDISESKEVDKMIYCEDFHGEYALQWIRCYKDGKLREQHNVQFLESVIFVRTNKPPCPIKKDPFLGTPPEDYVGCPEYCSDCKYEPMLTITEV